MDKLQKEYAEALKAFIANERSPGTFIEGYMYGLKQAIAMMGGTVGS